MRTSNHHISKSTPSMRRRNAARIRDWRARNELRERMWEAIRGPKGDKVRAAVERAIRRTAGSAT